MQDVKHIEMHERARYLEMTIETKNDEIEIYDKEFKFTINYLHSILSKNEPFALVKVNYISWEEDYDRRVIKMEISDWITTAMS